MASSNPISAPKSCVSRTCAVDRTESAGWPEQAVAGAQLLCGAVTPLLNCRADATPFDCLRPGICSDHAQGRLAMYWSRPRGMEARKGVWGGMSVSEVVAYVTSKGDHCGGAHQILPQR